MTDRSESDGTGSSKPPAGIRASSYLPEIESLRGIAIALVYAVHLDHLLHSPFRPRDPSVSIGYAFVRAGQTGVDLFFVLSGFLLSLPFLREVGGGPAVGLKRYFQRRALRILPLYWIAVALAALLSAGTPSDLGRALPWAFFLNSFSGLATGMQPYSNVWWSLATEAQFYLLLPVLPWCLRSSTGRKIALTALVAYGVAYAAFLHGTLRAHSYEGQHAIERSIFGRAPLFLAGIAVAAVYQRFGEQLRARLRAIPLLVWGGADLLLLAVVVALGHLLRWTVEIGWLRLDLPPYHAWHLLEAVAWGAIVFLILLAPLRLKPLVCNRFFAWLGVISYSLYLIHYPLLVYASLAMIRAGWWDLSGWNARGAGLAVCLTAVCVTASALSYRFIERPFLLRKARVGE